MEIESSRSFLYLEDIPVPVHLDLLEGDHHAWGQNHSSGFSIYFSKISQSEKPHHRCFLSLDHSDQMIQNVGGCRSGPKDSKNI